MSLRTRARRATALPAVAVLLGVLSAPASAEPLLHQQQLPGAGWTAATVTTDGSRLASSLVVTEVARPFQAGVRVYDEAKRPVYAATLTELGSADGVLVDAELPGGVSVGYDELEESPTRLGGVEVVVTLNGEGRPELVGRYTVLVWAATASASGTTWRVEGGSGTALLGTTSGRETFLHASSEFSGAANVQAGSNGLALRASYDTSRSLRVRRLLVGSLAPVLTSADALSVELPDGRTTQCVPSCDFTAVVGAAAARAGTYVFRLSGAGAGGVVQNTGEVLLGGADVQLPREA